MTPRQKNATATDGAKAPAEPASAPVQDAGQQELQAQYDEATAKGFYGKPVDGKPNEHYTFPGPPPAEPNDKTPEGSDAQ